MLKILNWQRILDSASDKDSKYVRELIFGH